ncbi:phosphoribosyl-AMP cyclohydrolase [Methanobrevibacter cuticularis]|uniref:Phosphoribosyl-AMP cyclohydrolase n=1 Tax=Methanobrevibacter cuticularis TaxID=47311 RepID=A0A166DQW8_9EURY|nr:phosphoribosyl-AMP cyclohydrolase [Methanobrevibacter cuticularis]
MKSIEEIGINFKIEKNGQKLVTAVVQDHKTLEILMVAFMNKEALQKTIETKNAHYWSTSRNKLWLKGESSGNLQNVKNIYIDCDMDAIVLKIEQKGAACHEGYYSCFFRELNMDKINDNITDLEKLENDSLKLISKRLFNPDEMYGKK